MTVIRENFDDVLRLAHSIREGKVSGALIMAKLGSYARQNKVAKALREMGRIEKTIFSWTTSQANLCGDESNVV